MIEKGFGGDDLFTKNSKVKEILEIEGILPLVEERIGKKIPPALLAMGKGMTLEKVGKLIKLSEEEMADALEELNEAVKALKEKNEGKKK